MIDLSRFWVTEWVVCAFFVYLILLAARRPLPRRHRLRVLATSIVCIGLSVMLSQLRPAPLLQIVREWIPGIYLMQGYWLCGFFFTRPMTAIEQRLIDFDRFVFRTFKVTEFLMRGPRVVLEELIRLKQAHDSQPPESRTLFLGYYNAVSRTYTLGTKCSNEYGLSSAEDTTDAGCTMAEIGTYVTDLYNETSLIQALVPCIVWRVGADDLAGLDLFYFGPVADLGMEFRSAELWFPIPLNLPIAEGAEDLPVPADEVLDLGKVDIDRPIRMTVEAVSGDVLHREYHDFQSVGPMHEPQVVVEKMEGAVGGAVTRLREQYRINQGLPTPDEEAALLNVGSKLPPPK